VELIAKSKVNIINKNIPFKQENEIVFDYKNRMHVKVVNIDNFIIKKGDEVIVISTSPYSYKEGVFHIVQRGSKRLLMDDDELIIQKQKSLLDE